MDSGLSYGHQELVDSEEVCIDDGVQGKELTGWIEGSLGQSANNDNQVIDSGMMNIWRL